MLFFIGCSFTWGAGLEYEYLHSERGYSVEQLNNMLPPTFDLESLDYNCDSYRKKHRYANLVAKELNVCHEVINMVNGGSNPNTRKLLNENPTPDYATYIIQFTNWARGIDDEDLKNYIKDGRIGDEILRQMGDIIRTIPNFGEHTNSYRDCILNTNSNWYVFSWEEDAGDVLSKKYPDNHIPIYLDGKEYNSFTETVVNREGNTSFNETPNNGRGGVSDDKGLRLCDVIPGLNDTHLSSKGHKMIADSIIRKLKK